MIGVRDVLQILMTSSATEKSFFEFRDSEGRLKVDFAIKKMIWLFYQTLVVSKNPKHKAKRLNDVFAIWYLLFAKE